MADSERPSSSTEGSDPESEGSESASDDRTEVIDWLAVAEAAEPAGGSDRAESAPATDSDESDGAEAAETSSAEWDPDEVDEGSIPTRRLAIIGGALVVLYLLVNFVDVWLASRAEFEGTAPAAVVLGAAQYNGEPSGALRGRLDTAAALYEDQRVTLVVVTGGGQEDDITTEAKTGYDYLRDTAAIPDDDLRLEVDGTSTYLSLAAVARFLAREEITDVVLVTDPYHAKRSQLIADEVGLNAEVATTDVSPSVGRLVRETGATAVGRLVGFRRLDAYVDL